jgi:uncharacterized protein
MAEFKKMTVERLRELARQVLGPGHSRLKTKAELVEALEDATAARQAAKKPPTRARAAGARAAEATGKAIRAAKGAVKGAGKAAREGARAVARTGKQAAGAAAEGARAGTRVARARKSGAVGKAAAAAAGAVAGVAAVAKRRGERPPAGLPDPEGFFVARVRGEEAVREAPHPMGEASADEPYPEWSEGVGEPQWGEDLGELPWEYGGDTLVALPRDPRTLFLYWDYSGDTVARSFEGLDDPRAQLWIFWRVDGGWDRLRAIEFALESRGYYVHDLEPGRTYRAEIHAVDRHGRDRLMAGSSNAVTLPPVGPSPVVDDRFVRIPWEMPLGRLLGPGHPGAPFSDEARALLGRLSDWSRFAAGTWGGSAGGMGGRPSSPTSSPSSPFSPFRGGEGGE